MNFNKLTDCYTLSNGVKIPCIGYGTWQTPDDVAAQSVQCALQNGYRHIDTAAAYGNEKSVGEGIRRSGVKREDIFVTTKHWIDMRGYEKTIQAFETSLMALGLDYLDLYLIHQPYGDVYGSWRAMEELYREGRIRAIGVSNFYPDRLQDLILHNEVAPAVNQVETHPFHQQTAAAEFMRTKGVQIESWAPFAEGKNGLFSNEVLLAVAARYKKTVAQVVLRWLIQRGVVCIPKSVHAERIAENFDVFGFALDAEDMAVIASLDRPESSFLDHRDPETVEWLSNLH